MKETLRDILFALASGFLLVLSFPYPDLGFLAYFALFPLLIVLYQNGPSRSFLMGCLAGLVFFCGISYWFLIYGLLPYALIVAATGLIIGVFGLGTSWVVKRTGFWVRLLFIPAFWVALETLRSELGSWSYPYGVLGYSQHSFLPVIQIASLVGVYGISFVIVLVNVALTESLVHGKDRRGFPTSARLVVAGILILSVGYGLARVNLTLRPRDSLAVAVVQVSVGERLDRAPDAVREMTLYEGAVLTAARGKPDLIVTPESTLPTYVAETDSSFRQVRTWAQSVGKPLLVGVPYLARDGRAFNTAQLFSSSGRVLARSAKLYPVPFGEFVPVRAVTERVYGRTAMLGDITPGNRLTVFDLRETRDDRLPPPASRLKPTFSVLLCSESSYSRLARRLTARGANLLFVLTNDAWFLKSPEAEQHFNMSKLRAVENGRYLVQAANSGVSGFVTPTGRVLARSELFDVVVLQRTVSFEGGKTVYTLAGWLFPWLCLVGAALGLVLASLRGASDAW